MKDFLVLISDCFKTVKTGIYLCPTHESRLQALNFFSEQLGRSVKINSNKHIITFPNGSKITFLLKTEPEKLRGFKLDILNVKEKEHEKT